MDHDYEFDEDYAPRVLWGRLAFFLLALVLAFVAGRACAPDGIDPAVHQAVVEDASEFKENNAVLEQQLDAAEGGNAGNNDGDGGDGGKQNNDEGGEESTEEPTDQPIGDGKTYTVQSGDTLTTIAEEVYGDPNKFDLIVDANNLTEDTPLRVGQELVIPEDS